MVMLKHFIEENGGYWEGECPGLPLEDWVTEVNNGDTRLGYWDWVYVQRVDTDERELTRAD